AATLGEWFGLFLILAGIGYFLVYLGDVLGGIWLAFVGFILRGAARAAIAQTEVTSRIEGVSVADVMDRDPVAIPESASIEQALDEYFLRYRSPWFPGGGGRGPSPGADLHGGQGRARAGQRDAHGPRGRPTRVRARERSPASARRPDRHGCVGPHQVRADDRRDREGTPANGAGRGA